MTRTSKLSLFCLPLLVLSIAVSRGQAPSGAVSFAFDQGSYPLWDLSGNYALSQSAIERSGQLTPVSSSVGMVQDMHGLLKYRGTTMLTIGTDTVAAKYVLAGKVTGGGNKTRAMFTVRLTGEDVLAGEMHRFTVSLSYNLLVTGGGLVADKPSSVRGTVSIAGLGTAKIDPTSFVTLDLPSGADGAWKIDMSILALNRLGGTAVVSIDNFVDGSGSLYNQQITNPRELPAKLNGTYSLHRNLATVSISGVLGNVGDPARDPIDGRGFSLNLRFEPGAGFPTRMTGRILGEVIRF